MKKIVVIQLGKGHFPMRLCHSHSENVRVLSEKNGLPNQIIGCLVDEELK